ncbi:hypothetical protein [Streptomyces sp. FXJ1.172]|uniref:hypothetical protein n=1 Tax=Streptomyces sp. FXJ1.172 TaxID=710705 RepID=UPI003FA7B4D9
MWCGVCGRRMESRWTHHRAAYRATAIPAPSAPIPGRAPNAYVRGIMSCHTCRPCTSASPATWIFLDRIR